MAKVLKEIFSASDKINQTYTIHSWHVSQSVDALTGADDYDITISGSLTVTGSVYLDGTLNINSDANRVLVLDNSNNQIKYGPDISTFTIDTGSLLTTASLSGTNLTFTKGNDSTFSITLPESGITNTGSFLTTASIAGDTLTFTKGDASTFNIIIPTGSDISTGSFLTGASFSGTDFTFTQGDGSTFDVSISEIDGDITISNLNVTNALTASIISTSGDIITNNLNVTNALTASIISTSGDLIVNNITASGDITVNNLNVITSFTASIISASSIIGDVTASAVGNNTEIQFNDGGIFGASPNLTWDKTTNVLTVKGGTNESYPSIFLTTTNTIIENDSILGRLEAFNTDESGESFNPGVVFKADKDWASPSTYNSRIEFKVVGDSPVETTQLLISSSGQIKFNSYGSGNFTGTPSKILATDSNGNIIETVNTNVIPEPGSFTSLNISDYFYKGLNEYDIQYINDTDPTINGAISVNNADPSLVTQLKISAKDDGGNTITSISKIVKGSVIYMKTSDDTPTVTYIAESNAVTGGNPTYTFYTVNVRPQIIIGGDNWQGTDGLTEFQIDNPINETISTGYHKYEISYESNLAASFNSDLLVRFRCDQSNNIGDTTLIEYKGVSTNNDGGYSQYAQLQAQTISSSLEVNNNYSSFHNNFDTGSGFVALMTVQSGSSKGFMILGNNQYV